MGVGELHEEIKVLGEVESRIPHRRKDQNTLLVLDGILGRLDGVEVDLLDCGGIDNDGGVVVKDDGCLLVRVPF